MISIQVAIGALITGIVVWALLVRKLTVKSWETHGAAVAPDGAVGIPAARVGLWVFLAVVTSLFSLFISAFYMRMNHGRVLHDWSEFAEPQILWFNSGLLLFASAAMQWARYAVGHGQARATTYGLATGGLLTLAFLGGQLVAWNQLHDAGFFTPSNPAIAFFYLLTAVHGLHLLGGLYVWARTLRRMQRKDIELIDVKLSVELCTTYWHYLLLVWIVLFALLLAN